MSFRWVVVCFLYAVSSFAGDGGLNGNPLFHVGNRASVTDDKPVVYGDKYLDEIQPILGARCVACHGCFEAPCQLNLQSYEGLRRGFNATPIYSSKRLATAYPTRMIDADSIKGWREKQFLPVVDSIGVEKEVESKDFRNSILYQLLSQGEKNKSGFNVKPLATMPWVSDSTDQACVATEKQYDEHFKGFRKNPWDVVTVGEYLSKYPSAGMPLGLPVPEEHGLLKEWIAAGAIGPSETAQKILETPANAEEIQRWEDFLNDRSHKHQQVARYIYEHVYTAHIQFKANPGEFFNLVRSKTRNGKIDAIVKELPYEAPGAEVFYRFRKITAVITHKNHFLWELDDTKLDHLKKLFFDGWKAKDEEVPLPSYVTKAGFTNANPFEYFESIPAMSRARFMIENSRVIVAAMTQGSVCVGTSATFAINDHFWAWFLKPESDVSALFPKLGMEDWDDFSTAVLDGENPLEHFARTVKGHAAYQEAYEIKLREWLKDRKGAKGLSIDDLWRGDGDPNHPKGNPNAWLNITRHEKSATVQFGPEGGSPHSIWVLSYSNFERLYYNLVASFKEWGSADHKAATWRHMSYVRIEGEDLAISFLPKQFRTEVRNRFARGVSYWRNKPYPQYSMIGLDNKEHFTHFLHKKDLPPRVEGSPNPGTDASEAISFLVIEARSVIKNPSVEFNSVTIGADRKNFERQLNYYQDFTRKNRGAALARTFPSVSYVRVEADDGKKWVFTFIGNRAYEGHNDMLIQKRTPQFDTFSVYRGFIGGYPNVILDVPKAKRRAFIEDIAKLGAGIPWETFRSRWGVARNSARFWSVFDDLHSLKATGQVGMVPAEQGVIDLSQYEVFGE